MATVPPHSIISGVEYSVERVDGTPPAADDAFEGQVELSLAYDPPDSAVRHEQTVRGLGLLTSGGIFVNEKDETGKDLRRWQVRRREDGGYVARQGLY